MDNDYLDILKKTNLRPEKIKLKEHEPVILNEQANDGEMDLLVKIIEWFTANPYPKDDAVHAFAQELGIDEHKFEGYIYHILSSVLSEGKSKGEDIKHDPKQLEMGIKVEMEHTTNPVISRKIALDHLKEIPDYYTRLDKMEKDAGVEHH